MICRLSYCLYSSHIYSRYINVYDDVKIETSLCLSSVVRRVSTNLSDNPRKTVLSNVVIVSEAHSYTSLAFKVKATIMYFVFLYLR